MVNAPRTRCGSTTATRYA